MKSKTILIASFIFPERIDWFLGYLEEKFNIPKGKVFAYKNLDDESKVIITFKFKVSDNKRVNFKELFPNATIIHKKGEALYTINALNKLIEDISEGDKGNIDHKSVEIDWSEYQNKFLLLSNDDLNISNIERIF